MALAAVAVLFAFLFALELRSKTKVYDFRETASHLAIAAGQQVANLFFFWILVPAYGFLFHASRSSPLRLNLDSKSIAAWTITLLATDFCFYLAHRLGHRSNFFIAAHGLHHQARDFNHLSAFRHSWINRPVMFLIYAPLALLGFPAEMVMTSLLASLVVQVWSHNGAIKRSLGLLEYVLVTPRTHRIHHGRSAPYLDKNFGGLFIFWDRLLGTYQDLDAKTPLVLGDAEDMDRHDPLQAHGDYFKKILFVAKHRQSLWGKVSIWFQTPETLFAELKKHDYKFAAQTPKAAPKLTEMQKIMVVAGLLHSGAATVLLIQFSKTLPWFLNLGLGIWAFAAIAAIGRVLSLKNPLKNPRTGKVPTHRKQEHAA